MNIPHDPTAPADEQSSLTLPVTFPFIDEALLRECRFFHHRSPPDNNTTSADTIRQVQLQTATAPATTTVRIIVPLPHSSKQQSQPDQSRQVSAAGRERRRSREVDYDDGDDKNGDASSLSPASRSALARASLKDFAAGCVASLKKQSLFVCHQDDDDDADDTGGGCVQWSPESSFPEVIFINPKQKRQESSKKQKEDDDDGIQEEGGGAGNLVIVVDSGCGEAVLRGGDVFAPGILASNRSSFEKGDRVSKVCAVVCTSQNGRTTVSGASVPLVGATVDAKYIKANTMVVASSSLSTTMSRQEIFQPSSRSGLAVKTGGGLYGHPSVGVLSQVAAEQQQQQNKSKNMQQLFLQNFSSLFPAAMLVSSSLIVSKTKATTTRNCRASSRLRILDCCAAPGGKSSHILSRCALMGLTSADVRLVCVERSPGRAKQLRQLLEQHHGKECVAECVLVVAGDANYIMKPGSKECKAVADFFSSTGEDDNTTSKTENDDDATTGSTNNNNNNNNNNNEGCFDGVLLDPPCTGFGLRPRLRPFESDSSAVAASADYQRKLLLTASRLVRPGGFVSYSTCTTTLEENERNVIHAQENFSKYFLNVVSLSEDDGDQPVVVNDDVKQMIRMAADSGCCRVTLMSDQNQSNSKNTDDDDDNGDDDDHVVDAPVVLTPTLSDCSSSSSKSLVASLRFGPAAACVSSSLSASSNGRTACHPISCDSVGFYMALFQRMV